MLFLRSRLCFETIEIQFEIIHSVDFCLKLHFKMSIQRHLICTHHKLPLFGELGSWNDDLPTNNNC